MISCVITAQLICAFVFTHTKSWFFSWCGLYVFVVLFVFDLQGCGVDWITILWFFFIFLFIIFGPWPFTLFWYMHTNLIHTTLIYTQTNNIYSDVSCEMIACFITITAYKKTYFILPIGFQSKHVNTEAMFNAFFVWATAMNNIKDPSFPP